jgi:dsDNA-specific endonuclease/ATPase MutS2
MELKNMMLVEGDIPLRGLKDIEGILSKLEIEGSVLDVQELLEIYQQLVLCKGLRRFFQKVETILPEG